MGKEGEEGGGVVFFLLRSPVLQPECIVTEFLVRATVNKTKNENVTNASKKISLKSAKKIIANLCCAS